MNDSLNPREREILATIAGLTPHEVVDRVEALISENRRIHDEECVNLNPASNVMNPRAEAAMAAGLGSRASLGDPGDKYEMGLEAIEQIEVIAAGLARSVFDAQFAEIRVGSGAMGNLYAFMATCRPGDTIIVPPADVAGHVTHQLPGAAGLYGLHIIEAPYDADRYSVDVDGLAALAKQHRPRLITMGASLNLAPHPVAEVRAIADSVGADILFDAAHACGMFSGRQWPNPLTEGADIMTMSTYKSLGGPPGGLVLTNRADLAQRIDAIAYPGLTANFDLGKTAALAITLTDWLKYGVAYGSTMRDTARALADSLADQLAGSGIVAFTVLDGGERIPTRSHQFALDVSARFEGGHQAALALRQANVLASAIGLPGRGGVGLRLGVPEMVRWGLTPARCDELALLIARGLTSEAAEVTLEVAADVSAFRRSLDTLHFVN